MESEFDRETAMQTHNVLSDARGEPLCAYVMHSGEQRQPNGVGCVNQTNSNSKQTVLQSVDKEGTNRSRRERADAADCFHNLLESVSGQAARGHRTRRLD